MADDGGRPEESSEAHVNEQSTSHLPLDIVTGGGDESPARVAENWGDRSTSSHLNQVLISRELLSQNLTPPNQTPLLLDGHDETASAVPQKRGRPPNTLMNASSKKVNIYSKSWGAILTVEEFQLEDVFRVYLTADSSDDAARFFETPPPPLANLDR